MARQSLGLIGLGQFGTLMSKHLAAHFNVHGYSPNSPVPAQVTPATFGQAAGCDIVVFSVPAAKLEDILRQAAPYIKPGALVMDVCSVKTEPAHLLETLVPMHAEVIATHPLFGPQSGANGIAGLKMVVCPLRTARAEQVETFLRDKLGLTVITTTPEEHDRDMAYVQALTHLIGRSLLAIPAPQTPLATQSYQNLLNMCALIRNDTLELFHSLQHQNPYAEEVTSRFLAEANRLLKP